MGAGCSIQRPLTPHYEDILRGLIALKKSHTFASHHQIFCYYRCVSGPDIDNEIGTMKGAILKKPQTSYEVVTDIEKPKPGADQILVKSIATAINPVYALQCSIPLI